MADNTAPGGDLTTTNLQDTTNLLGSADLTDAVVDREATLVRTHGHFWAGFSDIGSSATNLLVRICIGIAFVDTATQLPSTLALESSSKWFVSCCVVLSPQQVEGVFCRIDSKAKRVFDTARNLMTFRVDMDVINGTLPADAVVTYGYAGRYGILTS